MTTIFKNLAARVHVWLNDDLETPPSHRDSPVQPGPGHAPGHRHLGPPPSDHEPHGPGALHAQRHQPWVPTGGLTDKQRRSERKG